MARMRRCLLVYLIHHNYNPLYWTSNFVRSSIRCLLLYLGAQCTSLRLLFKGTMPLQKRRTYGDGKQNFQKLNKKAASRIFFVHNFGFICSWRILRVTLASDLPHQRHPSQRQVKSHRYFELLHAVCSYRRLKLHNANVSFFKNKCAHIDSRWYQKLLMLYGVLMMTTNGLMISGSLILQWIRQEEDRYSRMK